MKMKVKMKVIIIVIVIIIIIIITIAIIMIVRICPSTAPFPWDVTKKFQIKLRENSFSHS